jgi:hypothetical protein
MPATAGRKARIKFSTTAGGAGTYTVVPGVVSISYEVNGDMIDVGEMGVDYTQRIQGLKDSRLTVNANLYAPQDAQQLAALSSLLSDTEIWVQVLPDNGVTAGLGFKQQMRLNSYKVDAGVTDKTALTLDWVGTGTITTV